MKHDVRDLGGHLENTFRGWSATLAARVRLVIARLVLILVLPLGFHRRLRAVRSMFIPGALHGIEASFLADTCCLQGSVVPSSALGQNWGGAQSARWASGL